MNDKHVSANDATPQPRHNTGDTPAPTWAGVLDAAKQIAQAQKPDDIVAFYMADSTFRIVSEHVGRGQSMRSYLGAAFGLPVHIDNDLSYMALEGVQRDGKRRRLNPTACPVPIRGDDPMSYAIITSEDEGETWAFGWDGELYAAIEEARENYQMATAGDNRAMANTYARLVRCEVIS
jgi:hypothetical protein